MVPKKTVARLILYKRFLKQLIDDGVKNTYSHDIATKFGVTATQVRRDLMCVGYHGASRSGYDVKKLYDEILRFFINTEGKDVVLVGVGNLGRALLSYFSGGKSHIRVVAAFDNDEHKVGRVICGCRCYHINELKDFVDKNKIHTVMLCAPATAAQDIAVQLIKSGVKGILNFSPVRLNLSADVYIEDFDITMNLEKVMFFAGSNTGFEEKINV